MKARSHSAFGAERDMARSQHKNTMSGAKEAHFRQYGNRGVTGLDVMTLIDGGPTYIKDEFWNY
ncbi:hypothetical protein [Sphingobacterium sp.]|uniref:hypothetical protein n=1 Tax=Sphingobacterium sp. TaxID=341027 RepID=UPI0028A7AA0C|nr:hypothetical protein [Sphingobacterium sp.]